MHLEKKAYFHVLEVNRYISFLQMNFEVQDELLVLLRSQQKELTELRGQIEAMKCSIMSQVDHALSSHREQERILPLSIFAAFISVFSVDQTSALNTKITCSSNILM